MHPFEGDLEKSLKNTLGVEEGKSFMSRYTNAKDKSIADVISQITGSEPDLTKHDASHIKNVLTRVHQLLGSDADKLSCYEMYALAIIVLFHDVGNIFGRKDHQTPGKVAKVYNHVRGDDPKWNQERLLVLKAVEAHTGKNQDGTAKDTLKTVDDIANLEDGQPIRLRELAAILRFADELEEGPGRTSTFKQKLAGTAGGYASGSLPYHAYSNAVNVFIDRGNGRIVLRYYIDWDKAKDANGEEFKGLLKFCFARILKLDDERKYCKYYTEFLRPFKKTEVTFHFSINKSPVELGLGSLLFEDDIPIPRTSLDGVEQEEIAKKDSAYNITSIFESISKTSPDV